MQIDEVRVAGKELILKSPDLAEIRRFAYNFKAGNYEIERKRKKRKTAYTTHTLFYTTIRAIFAPI